MDDCKQKSGAVKDGGPAFPTKTPVYLIPEDIPDEWRKKIACIVADVPGLTILDWFAGMALQGMIAGSQGLEITTRQFAEQSFKLAAAMLSEREKRLSPSSPEKGGVRP